VSEPVWDIQIGSSSAASRVVCNGQDISRHIRKVIVTSEVGKVTAINLELIGSHSATAVAGIMNASIAVPTEDITAISDAVDRYQVLP
jgi:hypothetical protein